MAKTSPHHHRLRTVCALLAVICMLIALATFGLQTPAQPFAPIDLTRPIVADSDGTSTAIVDSEARRILILNDRDELRGMVNCERLNSPLEAITDVCVVNDTIYVAGILYHSDSDIIARERIVSYDLRGRSEKVLFDHEVNNNLTPEIKTMDDVSDGAEFVLYHDEYPSAGDAYLEILHVNRDGIVEKSRDPIQMGNVYDIGYSQRVGAFATIDHEGSNFVLDENGRRVSVIPGHVFTTLDLADDGTTYLVDDTTETVCRIPKGNPTELETLIPGTGFSSLHINHDTLSLCNLEDNSVTLIDLKGTDVKAIDAVVPTKALSWLRMLVLLCRLYLVFYLAIILVLKARDTITSGSTEGFGPAFASVVVVGVVALAIGYTSYGSYQTMWNTRENEINSYADYLNLLSSRLSPSMQACANRDAYRDDAGWSAEINEAVFELDLHVEGLTTAATNNGIGTYATIYAKDDRGIFYLYDTAWKHVRGSSLESSDQTRDIEDAFDQRNAEEELSFGTATDDSTMRRLIPIPSVDGTEVIGVVEIGCRLRSFQASVAAGQTERIIALLVIMLVVYLTYVELRACARCFISYGELRHHHDAIAILTRPFSFLVTMLASIDSVMTTLIARSLIASAGLGNSSMLLALPAVMLGVGLALGQVIYSVLGSHVVVRKLMSRGAILMMCAAIFATVVVWIGNFWLYCVAKLLMTIPFGLLYTLSYSLPRQADTDEVRALAAGGIKRTDTSAAALGNVLGGYAAHLLGNAWVYVLVAVTSAVVVIMAWRLLPETNHPLERKVPTASRREAIFKLLGARTTPPIIFFLMLPAILSAGYNSFLFPLFSADLGLPTSSINNLFVFGQLVVFTTIPTLERFEERYDKWRVALVAVALLSVVFLLFSFNTTLVWAAVTIALVGILCKASDGWKALWPRSAEAAGLTTGIATGVMFSVRSVLLIVQPLFLSTLLMLSSSSAVIVLGLVCAVCATAFYLTTRKGPLSPHDA